jgi:hypothetical protein
MANNPSFLAPSSIARAYARVSPTKGRGAGRFELVAARTDSNSRGVHAPGGAMTKLYTAITIVPIESVRDKEPTTFREVIAYLNGVADTVAAHFDRARPVSLAPAGSTATRSSESDASGTRITLRFGEVPFAGASVWPHVVVGSSWEPTRGGARTVDLGECDPSQAHDSAHALRRYTLPYDAPSVSISPITSAPPAWADERSSQVRLRAGALPPEWYELTGAYVDHAS